MVFFSILRINAKCVELVLEIYSYIFLELRYLNKILCAYIAWVVVSSSRIPLMRITSRVEFYYDYKTSVNL